MRKSIGAAMAALVVAGTAFMACGDTSEEDEFRHHYGYLHPLMNCVNTEVSVRRQQGLEVTEEGRREIEWECEGKIRKINQ